MGIPGFYGYWLSRNVREAVYHGLPPYVASLAFDLNGVFHAARVKTYGDAKSDDPHIVAVYQATKGIDPKELEVRMFMEIENILLEMIAAVKPQDCLILSVDGVAPGAKMLQQRGRRERAAKESVPGELFDRNAITPGTDFMQRLDKQIVLFIAKHRNNLPGKVIYSSHLVPGEGEHKIMDYYRRGEASDGPAAADGAAHVLYGLDADLIMLSLLSPLSNIYLSRETVKETVSIDRVKEYLQSKSQNLYSVDDFVVMMFFVGNDFLPHTPSLEQMSESIEELLKIYSEGEYELTTRVDEERRRINWDHMARFTQVISTREPQLLATTAAKDVKYPSKFLRAAISGGQFYPETFRNVWYQNALGPRGEADLTTRLLNIISQYIPSDRDYQENSVLADQPITAISEVTPKRVELMAIDYIRTMEWIYLYYREGTAAINQDWTYRYYHTPLLEDLAVVMSFAGKTYEVRGYEAYPGMKPFTALHQMVAVLPMESRELLPVELQPLFSYNSPLRDIFPKTFTYELDGKNVEHAGVPIVPLVDRNRVLTAVSQVSFTAERAVLWVPAQEQIFRRTVSEAEILAGQQFIAEKHEEFLRKQEEMRARRGRRDFRGRGRGDFRGRGRGRGDFSGRGRGDFSGRGRGEYRGRGRGGYTGPRSLRARSPTRQIRQSQPTGPVQAITRPPIQTRVPAQPVGEFVPTQPITRAPTQPITRAPTQPITRAPTQPITRAPTQPITRAPTQPITRAPTQPITRAPTQPITRAPTQPITRAPTQPITRAPTQPLGMQATAPAYQPRSPSYNPRSPTDLTEQPTTPVYAPRSPGYNPRSPTWSDQPTLM